MCHYAAFCSYRSNNCADMADFWLLKMATVRHLGFLKVGNFTCRPATEGHCASCQILHWLVKPFRRYGHFFRFSGWQQSTILDFFKKFKILIVSRFEAQYPSLCLILCRSIKPLWGYGRFSSFQDGGRPPSWIFNGWKLYLPNCSRDHRSTLACQIWPDWSRSVGTWVSKISIIGHICMVMCGYV